MGVPKFYRWISERYPCLSQIIQEHQIPEFDNLYLDMNGIIHPCSHPNDDDPHFRKSEEDVFEDIFHYIEVLFRIIKPKKVFFMAVDGVAPRAKMNQQRGRRFRSAKEAQDNIRKALEKGQVLPKEERFDSNCITPGTPFMVRLHEQLKFFISYKISTDPAWQGLRIYLSGHETPGEGEHKIMEFIRHEKTRPDHDPNTRHCLYGLDADLIMLGLSSHEPHFSLLREEVRFGKAAKRITKPEKTSFYLLHLSLLREYLDWEFSELKGKLSFEYDLERIIDDWILMGFLVGNDFIPHLPNLHINHDALPYLYKMYIEVLPLLEGYLHCNGKLELARFEQYLTALSKFDREQFEEKFVDMKWFESKLAFKCGHEPPYTLENDIALDNAFAALEASPDDLAVSVVAKQEKDVNPEVKKLAERFEREVEEVESDDDTFEIEFAMFKRNYYMEKLGYEDVDKDVFAEQTAQYIRGIQWILLYYFCGVRSWSWFYPFHYAPFMSDIRNFSDITIEFDLGTPFLPFEQLLAVLPAASRQLLPKPFQNLMIMEQSPIIEYYPPNFKTDLNGKQHEWEAVVLIPFIDEGKLLDAMKPLYSRLSEKEIARNRHGPCLLYMYKPSLSFTFPSSLPGKFPDVTFCHAMCEELPKDAFICDIKLMRKGLADGVKLDVYNPGFPTLYHVPHKAKLHKANVKVFQMHSRGESMILQILDPQQEIVPLRVADRLLGETCYVGWPHLVEALAISVCDGIYRYTLSKDSSKNNPKEILQELLTKVQFDSWAHQVSELTEHLKERKGIELGHTSLLLEACPIRGKRFVCGVKGLVSVEKEWSPMPSTYPYQLTVKDIHCAELDDEQSIQTIEQLFPVGTVCFMLASPYYGASGEVVEIDVKQSRVRVQLYVPSEPDIASVIDQHQRLSLKYLPAHVVAKKLGISTSLLSRITGSFRVNQGSSSGGSEGRSKFDIGLNMKFSKQNKEVLGFAKRTEEGSWTFSPKAHKAIADYLHRFPQLFDSLANMPSADKVYEGDLVLQGNGEGSLSDVQEWLKTVPSASLEPVKCGSISLDEPVVEAIEKAVQEVKVSDVKSKTVKVRVRPHLLFRPSEHQGSILPDRDTQFELFDRVVNVKLNGAVPFGLRGTLIGIHQGDDSTEAMYEVVFDKVFLGGQPLRCSSNKVSLMEASSLLNLSYGARCESKQSEMKVSPRRLQYQGGKGSYTSPLSPSVGASPELGKKHRNKVADTKVDSSGNVRLGSGFESHQSESPGQTHLAFTIKDINARSGERNWEPPHLQKDSYGPSGRSGNGLSEFADMWKELKLKEVSCPDKHDTDTEDNKKEIASRTSGEAESQTTHASSNCTVEGGTQALLDLLQGKGKGVPKTSKHVGNKEQKKMQPTQGQQLTVDELFRSQGAAAIPTVSQSPSHEAAGALPSIVLFHWCCAVGLRPPIFHYTATSQGVFAVVEISNGFKFPGAVCGDRGEAAESASSVALFQLPRIMPSFPSPVGLSPPKSFVELPQQHFRQGFFSHPVNPVLQPFVQVFPPRLTSNQNSPHELASMNQLALGKSPQQLSSMNVITQEKKESTGCQLRDSIPQTAKDGSTNLNVSAAPFIPLQVARRNSAMRQNSPAKGAKSSSQNTISNFDTPEDISEQNKNSISNSDKGLQCHSNEQLAGVYESQEVSTRCTSKLKKTSGPLQKTQISRQRLLAPSFFAKKT